MQRELGLVGLPSRRGSYIGKNSSMELKIILNNKIHQQPGVVLCLKGQFVTL